MLVMLLAVVARQVWHCGWGLFKDGCSFMARVPHGSFRLQQEMGGEDHGLSIVLLQAQSQTQDLSGRMESMELVILVVFQLLHSHLCPLPTKSRRSFQSFGGLRPSAAVLVTGYLASS